MFIDKLASECMLFYMGYLRSLGCFQFHDSDVIGQRRSDAKLIIWQLMIRDLQHHRVYGVLNINESLKRNLHSRLADLRHSDREYDRMVMAIISKAPPFTGQPWPTETTIVYRQSQPLK